MAAPSRSRRSPTSCFARGIPDECREWAHARHSDRAAGRPGGHQSIAAWRGSRIGLGCRSCPTFGHPWVTVTVAITPKLPTRGRAYIGPRRSAIPGAASDNRGCIRPGKAGGAAAFALTASMRGLVPRDIASDIDGAASPIRDPSVPSVCSVGKPKRPRRPTNAPTTLDIRPDLCSCYVHGPRPRNPLSPRPHCG